MTGSGARRPPNPWHSLPKFSQWCEFFLSGAYGKANKRDQIRLTETEHQRLLDRCDRTHLAEWLRQLGLENTPHASAVCLMWRRTSATGQRDW